MRKGAGVSRRVWAQPYARVALTARARQNVRPPGLPCQKRKAREPKFAGSLKIMPAAACLAEAAQPRRRDLLPGRRSFSEGGSHTAASAASRSSQQSACSMRKYDAGVGCQRYKEKAREPKFAGSLKIMPAATYSPTHFRMQYHRRYQA